MFLFLWFLLMPFQSHELVIPPSPTPTATRTTGPVESAAFVATPEVEGGAQIVLGQRKLAICDHSGGDAASPLKCLPAHACTSTDSSWSWECCNEVECEGKSKIYVDYGDDKCGALGKEDCRSKYTSVLSCPSDTPLCIRYARSSGLGDTSTIYSLGCAKTHEAISATSTVISGPGMMESVVAKVVLDGVQGKPTALSQTSTAEKDSSTTKNSDSNDSSGKLDTSDIIAIVIPSVAVIVTIVVGWWEPQQVQWFVTCGYRGDKMPKSQSLWKKAWRKLKKLKFWGK